MKKLRKKNDGRKNSSSTSPKQKSRIIFVVALLLISAILIGFTATETAEADSFNQVDSFEDQNLVGWTRHIKEDGGQNGYTSSAYDGTYSLTGETTGGNYHVFTTYDNFNDTADKKIGVAGWFTDSSTAGWDALGLVGRLQDAGNAYKCKIKKNTNDVIIEKEVDGSVTELKNVNATFSDATWYFMWLEIKGDTLTFHTETDGADVEITATDTAFSSGDWGIIQKISYNDGDYYDITQHDAFGEYVSVAAPTDAQIVDTGSDHHELSWTNSTDADYTYIERNTSENWSIGEGTEIYNNTGESYTDSSLDSNTHYYYQLWAYNESQNKYSADYDSIDGSTDDTTTMAGEINDTLTSLALLVFVVVIAVSIIKFIKVFFNEADI